MPSQLVLVKIPPGTKPGSTVQVQVGGQTVEAQVPSGGVTEFYISIDNPTVPTIPATAPTYSAPPKTDFDMNAERAIPASIHMISGCADSQTSADVYDTSNFRLPKTMGRAGGACTSALLQVLYKMRDNAPQASAGLSWVDVLRQMRTVLLNMGYDQVPQLTSSRWIDVRNPFYIINPENPQHGTRRAVLIGICYKGQDGELSGCHNDVIQVINYLTKVQGFNQQNITVLMDDGRHSMPTYRNIMDSFRTLAQVSMPGDTAFVHYSGHGGRVADRTGDEDDGYDETLIPVDFQRTGQIVDDDISNVLVKPMRKGVTMTCIMDCCHSGTVLDLPYRFTADGDVTTGMYRNNGFNFMGGGAVEACCCLFLLAELLT